ncbi:MAG: hypothetical protein IMY71_09270 [Bacteroidetes bacterium]|nr:hypothetical protein [Bacteroidota bacterium]
MENGMMEKWNSGRLGRKKEGIEVWKNGQWNYGILDSPVFQHSNIPVFQYSRIITYYPEEP